MALAHSTFGEICGRICDLSGLQRPTQAEFDADSLDRPVLQIKRFVAMFNSMAGRTLHELFTERVFTFNTVGGQSTQELDETTSLECVTYHSMRNITTGQKLEHLEYREWRDLYPQGLSTQSQPIYWIPKPDDAGAVERSNKIILSPTPGAIYQIEYQAKVVFPQLATYAQKIVFPPYYEDVLTTGGLTMIEKRLEFGDWSDLMLAQLSQVRAWATGAKEKKVAVSFGGLKIGGPSVRSGRFYDWNRW